MKLPLIIDPEDEKWLFLQTTIRNLEGRKIGQEISKAGFYPIAFTRQYLTENSTKH